MPIMRRRHQLHRRGRGQNRSMSALFRTPDASLVRCERRNAANGSSRCVVDACESGGCAHPDCIVPLVSSLGVHDLNESRDGKCMGRRGICFNARRAGDDFRIHYFRSGSKGWNRLRVLELRKGGQKKRDSLPRLRRCVFVSEVLAENFHIIKRAAPFTPIFSEFCQINL